MNDNETTVVKILQVRQTLRERCNTLFTEKNVADSIYCNLVDAIDWDCDWYYIDNDILEQGAESSGK